MNKLLNKVTPVKAIISGLIIVALTSLYQSGAPERQLMNTLHNANKPLPEWVEVNALNHNDNGEANAFVTYGLGGQTCNSIITLNADGSFQQEIAKRCSI